MVEVPVYILVCYFMMVEVPVYILMCYFLMVEAPVYILMCCFLMVEVPVYILMCYFLMVEIPVIYIYSPRINDSITETVRPGSHPGHGTTCSSYKHSPPIDEKAPRPCISEGR